MNRLTLALLLTIGGALFFAPFASAEEAASLDAKSLAKLHAMIKPQANESRWMEVDWYPSVWEARKIAAKEGKPIFLMAGSGGAPAAGC